MPAVSIIIVSFNTVELLGACLHAVYAHSAAAHEVIVVDNDSRDGSAGMVRARYPQVVLIEAGANLGFGAANNLAVARARHAHVMLLNSDAMLQSDTASALAGYLEQHPDVACVAPRVVLPGSGAVQPKTFGFHPTPRRVGMQALGLNRLLPRSALFAGVDGAHRWDTAMSVGWVSGVCMLMRTRDFIECGGFDQRFFMYCEDVELCMKLAPRGRIVLLDRHDVIHIGGASSRSAASRVRNSVWQQHNLLIIVQDYYGLAAARWARAWITLGLTLRLFAGIAQIPLRGIHNNALLQSTWARLHDAVRGFSAYPGAH